MASTFCRLSSSLASGSLLISINNPLLCRRERGEREGRERRERRERGEGGEGGLRG